MNVNTLQNKYWLFRPFTWLSMLVGAATVILFIMWLFTMLLYAQGS